ncbi:MAG: 4Fe-4S dicluster domain-containing protein [Myxococcales bacterium]|nr:MAG: 4Fe-4S dicluster domain-containing protein [Myxococcales bacterium]
MESIQIYAGLILVAGLLYVVWRVFEGLHEQKSSKALAAAHELGEVLPPSIHPKINPDLCIGSGACIKACPEKGVIGMVGGRANLVGPLACIGHGACAAACPVHAIELVFGTEKEALSCPRSIRTSKPVKQVFT